MPLPGFYNDNQNRSYPLIHVVDHDVPPDGLIVDFGCTMGEGAGFIEGEHSVFLAAIRQINNVFEFEFHSDAPGLAGKALIFRRMSDAPEYQSSYAEASFNSSLGTTVMCAMSDAVVVSGGGAAAGMPAVAAGDASCPDGIEGSGDMLGPEGASAAMMAFMNATASCEVCSKGWLYYAASEGMSMAEYNDHCGSCSSCYGDLAAAYGLDCFRLPVCDPVLPPLPPWVVMDSTEICDRGSVRDTYCYDDTPWSGYLVTGDLRDLPTLLGPCPDLEFTSSEVGAVHLLFLTDTPAAAADYIQTLKHVFPVVAQALATALPNFTFEWAVASYRDFEDGADYADGYKLDQAFTSNAATAATAIDSWTASGGGDSPEQQIAALKKIAEEWETTVGGSAIGSGQRVILWGGDTNGWENGAKSLAYPVLGSTIATLVAEQISVFAINKQSLGSGLDGAGVSDIDDMPADGRNQASAITAATGGKIYPQTQVTSALEIARIIAETVADVGSLATTTTACGGIVGNYPVEPATIQSMVGSYVRTVNIANAERTRSTSPDECRDHCWSFPLKEHYVESACLEGVIRVKPGYNSNIYQEAHDNKLILGARPGAGEGISCGPVSLTSAEAPPDDRSTLDGGLTCDEVVRSINGVGKQFFTITGGSGVVVSTVPEEHKIVIDVDLRSLVACISLPAQGELVIAPVDEAPCDTVADDDTISP